MTNESNPSSIKKNNEKNNLEVITNNIERYVNFPRNAINLAYEAGIFKFDYDSIGKDKERFLKDLKELKYGNIPFIQVLSSLTYLYEYETKKSSKEEAIAKALEVESKLKKLAQLQKPNLLTDHFENFVKKNIFKGKDNEEIDYILKQITYDQGKKDGYEIRKFPGEYLPISVDRILQIDTEITEKQLNELCNMSLILCNYQIVGGLVSLKLDKTTPEEKSQLTDIISNDIRSALMEYFPQQLIEKLKIDFSSRHDKNNLHKIFSQLPLSYSHRNLLVKQMLSSMEFIQTLNKVDVSDLKLEETDISSQYQQALTNSIAMGQALASRKMLPIIYEKVKQLSEFSSRNELLRNFTKNAIKEYILQTPLPLQEDGERKKYIFEIMSNVCNSRFESFEVRTNMHPLEEEQPQSIVEQSEIAEQIVDQISRKNDDFVQWVENPKENLDKIAQVFQIASDNLASLKLSMTDDNMLQSLQNLINKATILVTDADKSYVFRHLCFLILDKYPDTLLKKRKFIKQLETSKDSSKRQKILIALAAGSALAATTMWGGQLLKKSKDTLPSITRPEQQTQTSPSPAIQKPFK
jgi:hypothetical protein